MKCPNCNADLPEDSAFCFDCGTPIKHMGPSFLAKDPTQPSAHGDQRRNGRGWLAAGIGCLIFVLVLLAANKIASQLYNPGTPTGQFSEEPCPNGILVFEDRFDCVPPLGEAVFSEKIMQFQQGDQTGRIYAKYSNDVVPAKIFLPMLYPGFVLGDGYLEIEVTPLSIESDYYFGVILGGDNSNHIFNSYHAIGVNPKKGDVEFQTRQNSYLTAYHQAYLPSGLLQVGKKATLRVEAVDDTLRVFVAEKYITTFKSSLNSGMVGFYVLPGLASEQAEVLFDNLKVYNATNCKMSP